MEPASAAGTAKAGVWGSKSSEILRSDYTIAGLLVNTI